MFCKRNLGWPLPFCRLTQPPEYPCVTFSTAGMKRGWCYETLDLFRTSVTHAKKIGVQYLRLENVAPLWTDLAWRPTLIQDLMNGGFHLIFVENIQVRATVPVDRTRFIAVAVETNVNVSWAPNKRFKILRIFGGNTCTMEQENMWFNQIPHAYRIRFFCQMQNSPCMQTLGDLPAHHKPCRQESLAGMRRFRPPP